MDDEAPEADSRYLKLPWQLVAGALFAVLAAALGVGLIASRNLREQLVVPTATAVPIAAVSVTPTIVATSTRAPTATVQPSAEPSTTPAVRASATPIAGTSVAATGATTSPVATVDPAVAAEVGKAYEAYWQVRAQALLALDATDLSRVAAGDELAALERGIDRLRGQGQAVRTSVDHNYRVISASENTARVFDTYVDDSLFVDASTQQPLPGQDVSGDPANRTVREIYDLQRTDPAWRVIHAARTDY